MRHRGGTFLFRAKVFFSFAHFGALQVTDFQSDFIQCTAYNSNGGQ